MCAEDIQIKELSKGRAYQLSIAKVEVVALKLEGFKARQVGAVLSPLEVKAEARYKGEEGNDWLIVVKDRDNIVMPYSTWEDRLRGAIQHASGAQVGTISLAGTISPYSTLIVSSVEELRGAYAEGWGEPFQFAQNKWLLRKVQK